MVGFNLHFPPTEQTPAGAKPARRISNAATINAPVQITLATARTTNEATEGPSMSDTLSP